MKRRTPFFCLPRLFVQDKGLRGQMLVGGGYYRLIPLLCCACTKTKNCVKQDDMQEITRLLRECDMVVLAAPVYWGNVPAVVKNMFDRLFGVAMEETKTFPKPLFSKKQKYFILTACHTQAPFDSIFGQSSGAVRNIKEFFRTGGMTYAGKSVWTGKSKTSMPKHIERKLKKCF